MIRRSLLVAALAVLAGTAPAHGHDIWITTISEGATTLRAIVNHGHPGDRKAPDPDKLFEMVVVSPGRGPRPLPPTLQPATYDGNAVLMSERIAVDGPGVWILGVRYDNGYWVETAGGYRNTSLRNVPSAPKSLSSMKFAKAVISAGPGNADAYSTVLGHRLEIVPLANPLAVKVGGRLPVRVLLDGKPLAGAEVERGDGITAVPEAQIPRFRTNEAGTVEIPIVKAGPHVLVVDHAVSPVHRDLSAGDLLNATLAFTP